MLDFLTIKEVKTNIGQWCRQMRKAQNLTKQELAEELDLSRFTVAKLENGENPTLETLLKVLQYFDEMKSLNQFVVTKTKEFTDNPSMY
ncbi:MULTISPECIES: helix-turn-helix domain-containing protein [Chryseobacterium]|uniref:helix-turn-helix domain-containing protein n=1 Tax=Chryseobacterium sp. R2A-55 TaxID=2744445 RepID=UPI001F3910E1|nr:helix-turn-helix transcriptional regulator [Chryseobacterium sp. R2A-55]